MRSLLLAVSFFSLVGCTRLDSEVVEFDGRQVEIATAGEGDHTVVFESGLGDGWRPWDKVADAVSADAHVFAYSRPGYGKSDDPTTSRDPDQIVEELRALLMALDELPPYVLVGHSFGGTSMERFARSYPEETAALVMVDGTPPGFLDECDAEGLDMCGIPSAALPRQKDVVQDEYNAFREAADEIAGGFGDYPVRVLTSTDYPGASDER